MFIQKTILNLPGRAPLVDIHHNLNFHPYDIGVLHLDLHHFLCASDFAAGRQSVWAKAYEHLLPHFFKTGFFLPRG